VIAVIGVATVKADLDLLGGAALDR